MAYKAGLRIGDCIERIDGFTTSQPTLDGVQKALGSYSSYDPEKGECTLKLELIRSECKLLSSADAKPNGIMNGENGSVGMDSKCDEEVGNENRMVVEERQSGEFFTRGSHRLIDLIFSSGIVTNYMLENIFS